MSIHQLYWNVYFNWSIFQILLFPQNEFYENKRWRNHATFFILNYRMSIFYEANVSVLEIAWQSRKISSLELLMMSSNDPHIYMNLLICFLCCRMWTKKKRKEKQVKNLKWWVNRMRNEWIWINFPKSIFEVFVWLLILTFYFLFISILAVRHACTHSCANFFLLPIFPWKPWK